jgi:hypothetical protein
MSIGVSIGTAALIGGGLSAAGGLASGLLGSSAASTASKQQQQSDAAAIAEQQREFNITQANEAPWLTAGAGGLAQLTAGTQPGGALVTPFGETFAQPAPFVAPTLDNSNDPGYAFRLQQGEQALERGAAASGGAFSGGTLKALAQYGQDYASNEYSNVYNRALTGYNTNFQDALTGYQTRFNAYNTNQTNQFNRLASVAGLGQNATNTLAQTGASTATNIGNLLTEGGNAAAAGTLGSASALNAGLGGLGSTVNSALNTYQNAGLLAALTGSSGSRYGSAD